MNKFKNLASKIAAGATVAGLSTLNASAQIVNAPVVNPNIAVNTVELAKTKIVGYSNVLIGAIGIIAVVMLIWGGYLYVTAGANEDNTKKAKQIVTWAFLGLGLAIFSYAIVAISISFIG